MAENPTLSISAGDLRADFWPESGLLGVSLSYRGEELLRRLDNLEAAKSKGSTAGIPLLYPWANRLAALHYRAAAREVNLDAASSILHFDDKGLPMHGVPWGQLHWKVLEAKPDSFLAHLDWNRMELLALFPFPHCVEISGEITANSLTLRTKILADSGSAVPVTFGFHPYFGIPHVPRAQWRVQFPAMRKIQLDSRGIPTGATEDVGAFDSLLGDRSFDDGFVLLDDSARFSLAGGGCTIEVSFLEGFTHAQIFAPKDKDFIALEPMTAPTDALVSGDGLRIVEPGRQFQASFRITVANSEKSS
jgi:aldose 1-epimerase